MTNLDYLYNPDAAKGYFGHNFFVDKNLNFRIIPHATTLPFVNITVNGTALGFGGLVDKRGEFVKGGSFCSTAYTPNEDPQRVPKTVVYMGMLHNVWGHAITDNLRCMWFLKSDVFKDSFKNCPLVYVSYWSTYDLFALRPTFKRLLEILEIDADRIKVIPRPMQFENVIFPDSSFYGENGHAFYTKEYREAIERVKHFAIKNQTPLSAKKIYYYYGRHSLGEERIAEYCKSKGYAIVRPENLSLDEQLNILINCESFASTLGSCSHNSVFLREGTEVIIIPRSTNYPAGYTYQATLDKMNNVNEIYIDSSLSIYETLFGPYCFIISEQLKKFFGDKFDGYADDDFKIFSEYAKASVKHGFKVNETAMPSYKSTYQGFLGQLKGREDLMKAYGMNVS